MDRYRNLGNRYSNLNAIPIDRLPTNAIFVDEVHAFKKMEVVTTKSGDNSIKGLNTETSTMGVALQMFVEELHKKRNDNKGVFTYSGTIVDNTITELYTQINLVAPDMFRKMNIHTLDDFLNAFTEISAEIEATASGNYELIERLRGFINLPELMNSIAQVMQIAKNFDLPDFQPRKDYDVDYNNGDIIPTGLPNAKVQNVIIPKNEAVLSLIKLLQDYGKEISPSNADGQRKRELLKKNLPIKITSMARLLSNGVEALYPDLATGEGSKLNKMIKNVVDIYNSSPNACQMIFIQRGKNNTRTVTAKEKNGDELESRTFILKTVNFQKEFINGLIEAGIPRDEIEVAPSSGANAAEQKDKLAKGMNAKTKRIAIGSVQTLGVGVNAQENLKAVHYFDPVWTDGEVQQMNGRAIRQGNRWNDVQLFRYITSLEIAMWSALTIKETFIKNLYSNPVRSITSDAFSTSDDNSASSGLGASTGDERIVRLQKLNAVLKKSQNALAFNKSQVQKAKESLSNAQKYLPTIRARVQEAKDDFQIFKEGTKNNAPYEISVHTGVPGKGYVKFNNKKDANDYIKKYKNNIESLTSQVPLIKFLGFEVVVPSFQSSLQNEYTIRSTSGKGGYVVKSLDLNIINRVLGNLESTAVKQREKELTATIQNIEKQEMIMTTDLAPLQKEVDDYEKKIKALKDDMSKNAINPPEWFTATVPNGTIVEYEGSSYVVLSPSTKDGKYGFYLDDESSPDGEKLVSADSILVNGVPPFTKEELKRNPTEENIDETAHYSSEDIETLQELIRLSFEGGIEESLAYYKEKGLYVGEVTDTKLVYASSFDNLMNDETLMIDEQPSTIYLSALSSIKESKGRITPSDYKVATALAYRYLQEDITTFDTSLKGAITYSSKEEEIFAKLKETVNEIKNGNASISDEVLEARNISDIIDEIKQAFPNSTITNVRGGLFKVVTPNNKTIFVDIKDEIVLTADELRKAQADHNLQASDVSVNGYYQPLINGDSLITVATNSKVGTVYHETLHAVWDMALTNKEKAILENHYRLQALKENRSIEEVIADAYAQWQLGESGILGKIFAKIKQFVNNLRRIFASKDNPYNVFEDIASGDVWARDGQVILNQDTSKKFSITNDERVVNWDNVVTSDGKKEKDKTLTQRVKDGYNKFVFEFVDDKQYLKLIQFDVNEKLGKQDYENDIYKRAISATKLVSSHANMLLMNKVAEPSVKALNNYYGGRLEHNVTYQNILAKANEASNDIINHGAFKGTSDKYHAFGVFLTAKQILELNQQFEMRKKDKVNYYKEKGRALIEDATANEMTEDGLMTRLKRLASVIEKIESTWYKLPNGSYLQDFEQVIADAPIEFVEAGKLYNQFNENLLSILVDGGLISEDTKEDLLDKYREYSPMYRDFSDTSGVDEYLGSIPTGKGKGIMNLTPAFRKRSGSGSDRGIVNPMDSIIKHTYAFVQKAQKNKVASLFVQHSNEFEKQEKGSGYVRKTKESPDIKKSVFAVWEDGKEVNYQTIPEYYYCLATLEPNIASVMSEIAVYMASMLRVGATISPSFIVRNFLRDTVFASVSSEYGFIPFYSSAKGLLKYLTDAEFRKDFMASGATFSNFSTSTTKPKDILDNAKPWKMKTKKEKLATVFSPVMFKNTLSLISEMAENSTRAGEFLLAVESGKTKGEAGYDAGKITLNFSRAGNTGRAWNKYIPFFNAAIQGLSKTATMFADHPMRTSLRITTGILLPTLFLYLLNKDEDWYEELPRDIRDKHWVWRTGDDKIIRVPRPQDLGVFASALERALDDFQKDDPTAWSEWLKSTRTTVLPNIIPAFLTPFIEWTTNYSLFMGKPIVGQKELMLPANLQYDEYTSQVARILGDITSQSPLKIDNLVRSTTATTGIFALEVTDKFLPNDGTRIEKSWSETAFARGLEFDAFRRAASIEQFYRLSNLAEQNHNAYGKKGYPSNKVRVFRGVKKRLRDLTKTSFAIQLNPKLSPEVKKERLNAIQKKKVQIVTPLVTKYKDAL